MTMTPDFDAIVLGAGVIGLAVARELALAGLQVMVLEKAAAAGAETSSRNSEVIHAGIYYPSGSLKAKYCVEGRQLLYAYCASHGVAAKRLGKLIAATSSAEEAKLVSIMALAKANGVNNLEWLTPADVATLEPELTCTKALLSPSTGIVDANAFMLSLLGVAESHGAAFAFNTRFARAARNGDLFTVTALSDGGEETDIACRMLINAAGHGAHEAARTIAGYNPQHLPPRFLAKGCYCSLSGKSPFSHLIYPVPVSGALGIHATLDMGGAVRFGPDIHWVESFDYALPPDLPEKFAAAIANYWPGVRERTLTPSYCGLRPKTHGPQEGFADFTLQDETGHGVKGLINLFGIESPGLTSSLAIAQDVMRRLQRP